MASDLISRKALLERLEKIYGTDSIVDKIMLRFLKKLIRKQPTVDAVEVVHGEWKHFENGIAYCSECGVYAVEDGTYYCPHCGANMRGKENASD